MRNKRTSLFMLNGCLSIFVVKFCILPHPALIKLRCYISLFFMTEDQGVVLLASESDSL